MTSAPCQHSDVARSNSAATLHEFEPVPRRWDPAHNRFIVSVSPGEYFVGTGGELISTVLGSCVSACVRDIRRNLGGINHFMLPIDSARKPHFTDELSLAMRYGNYAMEHLLNVFYARGSQRRDLQFKLFGGGQVMASNVRIGEKNVEFARRFLRDEGYVVEREDVGGYSGRKLLYDPSSGRALVKRIHSDEEQELVRLEQDYVDSLRTNALVGEVELF